MIRRASILLALAACVPPSEELPPAGAAGFATRPSPAARGEPFVTDDGWTVRFEKVVFSADVSARREVDGSPPTINTADRTYFSDSTAYLWNGAAEVDLYVSGVPEGAAVVSISMQGRYVRNGVRNDLIPVGVDETDRARFARSADLDVPDERGGFGPSMYFRARGEKGGRSIEVELALATFFSPAGGGGLSVEVHRDAFTGLPLGVFPEKLFGDYLDGRALRFEPVALADADGDGRATLDELRAAQVNVLTGGCEDCPSAQTPKNVLDLILLGTSRILVTNGPPADNASP